MRGHSDQASKRKVIAVHCAAFAGLVSPDAAYRCSGRLLFCLWRSCGASITHEQCCNEKGSDRALTATWVVDELRVAVERGYRLLKSYEFYEYEVTQYDPKTGEGGHLSNILTRSSS